MNRLLILKGILRACINLVSETFDFPKLVSRFVGRLVVRKKMDKRKATYSYLQLPKLPLTIQLYWALS
jgi:hypothetical protein